MDNPNAVTSLYLFHEFADFAVKQYQYDLLLEGISGGIKEVLPIAAYQQATRTLIESDGTICCLYTTMPS